MVGKGLGVTMMTDLMTRGRTVDVLSVPVTPPAVREMGMGIHSGRQASENMLKLKECVLEFIREREGR